MSQYKLKPPPPPVIEAFHLQEDNLSDFIDWARKHRLNGWTVGADQAINWLNQRIEPTGWIVKTITLDGSWLFQGYTDKKFQNKFDPIDSTDT